MARAEDSNEIKTRISVEAERLVDAGAGPTALVASLVMEGSPDLAALAAERHYHAVTTRLADEHRRVLAERSPVFMYDPRTLIAAPVGLLEDEGLARFCDRVLAEVAAIKPARVVLVLQGFDPHEGANAALGVLAAELTSHGVSVERR